MKKGLVYRVKNYLFDKDSGFFREMSAFGNFIVLSSLILIFFGWTNNFLEVYFYFLLLELFSYLIKLIFYRDRPKKEKHANIIEKISASSFPSSHSARSIFVFFVLFSNLSGFFRIILLLVPIGVGFSRVLIRKHYISDVLAGYVLGTIFFLSYILF
jgi:membrane-associated phospholipid phosphatase